MDSTAPSSSQHPPRTRPPSHSQSTHIPQTTPSTGPTLDPPEDMSVDDFVNQPGRVNIKRLHPQCPPNTTWFHKSGNGIAPSINKMIIGLLKHPYETYAKMPIPDQDMWFRMFAQEFSWSRNLGPLVRREFDTKCGRMYSRKLNEWKQKWKNQEVPKEFVGNSTLWNGFSTYWCQEATKAKSTTASTNRMSRRNGKGPSTHNLGATSKSTKADQLFKETGVKPTLLDMLKATHTNKQTKEIQCQLAREICENVEKQAEEYIQSQPVVEGTPAPEVSPDMWNQFVLDNTPVSKGRLFGIPNEYHPSRAATIGQFSSDVEQELRQEIAEKTTQIDNLKNAFDDYKTENAEKLRRMEARMDAYFSNLPPPS